MRVAGAVTEVIERIYAVDAPAHVWLESVRGAAERSFDGHIGVQTYMFEVGADGSFQHGESVASAEMEAAFRAAHRLASPELIRAIYQRGPVVRLSNVIVGREQDLGYRAAVDSGLGNITLSLGIDPSGIGCALVFALPQARGLSRSARQALERIAAHLGSARRLRASAPHGEDEVDAVLNGSGDVMHAERGARDGQARRCLREAALRIDRARTRTGALEPVEALGLWRALVDGRWSLVERFDSDGRRLFVARRNEPTVRQSETLSTSERKVVAMLAVGHSVKLCAYELGFAQSTVSELASSAMRKLGVQSRAELVELHGAIIELSGPDDAHSA